MTSRLRQVVMLARLGPFRNAYLGRGMAAWILLRLALAWGGVPHPGVTIEIATIGIVGLAVWGDARRRGEDLFIGNLSIPSWTIAVMAVPLAALAELVVR